MTTARALITAALSRIGVRAAGETIGADDAADSLVVLNAMFDAWGLQRQLVGVQTLLALPLNGSPVYTVGEGGDLNSPTPTAIGAIYYRLAGVDYPLMSRDADWYDALVDKTLTGSPTDVLAELSRPLPTVRFYPIPASGTAYLRVNAPFTQFAALDTEYVLPSGWQKALIENLAIELALNYGAPVTPALVTVATEALAAIKRISKPSLRMIPDTHQTGCGGSAANYMRAP